MYNEKPQCEEKYEFQYNTKLYEFLASNYDISILAKKISAAKYAQSRISSLKRIVNPSACSA